MLAAPFAIGDVVFTLVVRVSPSTPGGAVLGNQAQLVVSDAGRETTFAATAATAVFAPAVVIEIPTLSSMGMALLCALLALGGGVLLRRRRA